MLEQYQDEAIYTVSELNFATKGLLESELGTVLIEGEISNFAAPASGHWYFTLKDAKAQVRCAMFRMHNSRVNCFPESGMHVLLKAKVSLYPDRGDYQLIVENLHDMGAGALQRQFEALKKQLGKEGLFATEHKLPLPEFPQTIGIITSPTGAALRDILSVLKRRYPIARIIIYPTQVQGETAAIEITRMVNIANKRQECDALILSRGGGSIEDLCCFNDEMLARALYACTIPTISGIGHEVDFTIADFVVDVRAPTPSAAAETVSPDTRELLNALNSNYRKLHTCIHHLIQHQQEKLTWLKQRIEQQHPEQRLLYQQQQLDNLSYQLQQHMMTTLQRDQHRLNILKQVFQPKQLLPALSQAQSTLQIHWQRLQALLQTQYDSANNQLKRLIDKLNLLNPLTILARGYSITLDAKGGIVSEIEQIKADDVITTQVKDGLIESKVIIK